MQHLWLLSASPSLTKKERRERRCKPPTRPGQGVVLYRCDGAARVPRNAGDAVRATCSGIRWEAGRITGSVAVSLGEATNNESEYEGLLLCLRDAHRRLLMEVLVQMDSLLVSRQASGVWRCKAPALIPYYEEALALIAEMRRRGSNVDVEQIYREFNAEADVRANRVLDQAVPSILDGSWML